MDLNASVDASLNWTLVGLSDESGWWLITADCAESASVSLITYFYAAPRRKKRQLIRHTQPWLASWAYWYFCKLLTPQVIDLTRWNRTEQIPIRRHHRDGSGLLAVCSVRYRDSRQSSADVAEASSPLKSLNPTDAATRHDVEHDAAFTVPFPAADCHCQYIGWVSFSRNRRKYTSFYTRRINLEFLR